MRQALPPGCSGIRSERTQLLNGGVYFSTDRPGLAFADDFMIFMGAHFHAVHHLIYKPARWFCRAVRLGSEWQKRARFSSPMWRFIWGRICWAAWSFRKVSYPLDIRACPSSRPRWTTNCALHFFIKSKGWKAKLITFAGRVEQFKCFQTSYHRAIGPALSIFPGNLGKRLRSYFEISSGRGLSFKRKCILSYPIGWDKLCKPKEERGKNHWKDAALVDQRTSTSQAIRKHRGWGVRKDSQHRSCPFH